jgi:hypothetical protein
VSGDDQAARLAKLREPFPPEIIGKLPRLTCKACSDRQCSRHTKIDCPTCGNYISPAHIHLDYVGHAATTDRLREVDPLWTWEPLAYNDRGLPMVDAGELWIKLTVCGVTRLGVGDGRSNKERIGDAIRNAAMRFGVALDLWAKEDLTAGRDETDGPAGLTIAAAKRDLVELLTSLNADDPKTAAAAVWQSATPEGHLVSDDEWTALVKAADEYMATDA